MRALAALLLLLLSAAMARADSGAGFWQWQHATGDWEGLRTALQNDGIAISGYFVGELSANPVGGLRQATRWDQGIGLGLDFDLQKLLGWQGGTFELFFTDRAGRSLSQDAIGNILAVQERYGGGETFRPTQMTLQQKVLNDKLFIEIGWQNTEHAFASSPDYWGHQIYCNFQSVAFCGTPQGVVRNSGYVYYPVAAPGAWVRGTFLPGVSVKLGAWEVNPTLPQARNAFQLGTAGASGVFLPAELEVDTGTGKDQMNGFYKLGAYFDTSTVNGATQQAASLLPSGSGVAAALPAMMHHGRWGLWLLGTQQIERDGPGTQRGVVVFGGVEIGDPETAPLRTYAIAGIVRRGTFPGREADDVALAVADAEINGRAEAAEQWLALTGMKVPVQTREVALELNYGIEVTPWLELRPGTQYIFNPAGTTTIPNAFVVDLKVRVVF